MFEIQNARKKSKRRKKVHLGAEHADVHDFLIEENHDVNCEIDFCST